MATLVTYANYASWLHKTDSSYASAHDAASGTATTGGVIAIGQDYFVTPTYDVYRGGLFFDTSSLALGVAINSATLSLRGEEDQSITDFNIVVINGADLNNPRVAADYGDLLDDTTSGGAISTSGFGVESYNVITLNTTGINWIIKGGTTKLGLRSSRDINSNAPTGTEWVDIYGDNFSGDGDAKLTITYTIRPKIFYF